MYNTVSIASGESSLDVGAAGTLDPELFHGGAMRIDARMDLLHALYGYLDSYFSGKEQWLRVWLAGSGASFRWNTAHDLRDLDILLGIDFVGFRQANPGWSRMGNNEITASINDGMRRELWPAMRGWRGRYEVTFYVNPNSVDIRSINPYAAYDMINGEWTVPPSRAGAKIPREVQLHAVLLQQRANEAIRRYSQSLTEIQAARSPVHRDDAERRFTMAVDQAVGLFDAVHSARGQAFTPTGGGYDDPANIIWQLGKKAGWVPALREIKEYHRIAESAQQRGRYGVELPTTDVLVRRALMHQ